LRLPRPRVAQRIRYQPAQQGTNRFGAEGDGLDNAAGMQPALGNHMAAIRVAAKWFDGRKQRI
jgi:hypothetical protein